MEREYEVVVYPKIEQVNILIVQLSYRAPHMHDDVELGMVLSGKLCLNTQAEEYRFCAGDMYLLNPKELHELSSDGDGAYVLALQLSPERLNFYIPWKKNFRFSTVSLREHLAAPASLYQIFQSFMIELAWCYFSGGPHLQRDCHDFLHMLIYVLDRHIPTKLLSDEQIQSIERSNYRIAKIIDYVEQNFRQKLLLSEIARTQGLSMSYLSHFFKDTLHITFQEYLNKQRFEYACGLLRTTDKSLPEISNLSGFSDVRYFIRLCEHNYGCSPQEYRSAHPPRFVEHPESTLQRICPPEECRELLADAHAKTCESLSKCSVWQFFHN